MILKILIAIPLVTSLGLLGFTEAHNYKLIRNISLYSAVFSFILSLPLTLFFDKLTLKFQFLSEIS